MLRNTNFEPGSEAEEYARNFSFPEEHKVEVEGMKDEYLNEATPKTVEKFTFQEEDGVNRAVLNFNHDFPNIDINDKKQMLEIQSHVVEAYEENPAAGKALEKLVRVETGKQLKDNHDKAVEQIIFKMWDELQHVTMDDIDRGIDKARSAHS